MSVETRAGAQRGRQTPQGAGFYANVARTPPQAPSSTSAGAGRPSAAGDRPRTPASADFSIMRPSRPAEQHSTTNYLRDLVKSLEKDKFTGEGNDVQELLNGYKERFEAAVITIEPPDEFVKLITLDVLDDEEIDENVYLQPKVVGIGSTRQHQSPRIAQSGNSRRARTAIKRGRPFTKNSCPKTHFREPLCS